MPAYIHTYIQTCIHVCMHKQDLRCVQNRAQLFVPSHIHTHVHSCMYECMHVYIHNIFGVDDITFVVCNKQGAVVCPVQQQPRTW